MLLIKLILAGLAAWRLTHLINKEDGPWNSIVKIRNILGNSFLGVLMDCFKCLSLWVAIPFSIFATGWEWETIVTWLAVSGASVIIEQIINKQNLEEVNNVMLWPTKSSTENSARSSYKKSEEYTEEKNKN
jgi:type VI protein secretion system component VasK